MTNSFFTQGSSLGFPTSNTNYLKTEADMAESVNKQIDENTKKMNKHFDDLIKMHNDRHKQSQLDQLLNFTKSGVKIANFIKQKNETDKKISELMTNPKSEVLAQVQEENKITDDLENESNENAKEAYTDAGIWMDGNPDISKMLMSIQDGLLDTKTVLNQAVSYAPTFKELALDTLYTTLPNGERRTYNDPRNTAVDRRFISADIYSTYISQFEGAVPDRLAKKYLIMPLLKLHESDLAKDQLAHTEAIKADAKEKRKDKLFSDLKGIVNNKENAGTILEDYMKTYAGFFKNSSETNTSGYLLAREELQDFLISGIKEDLDIDFVIALEDAIRNHKLTPNDGGKKRTIQEYLPSFSTPVLKAIHDRKKEHYIVEEEKKELEVAAWVTANLSDFQEVWSNLSEKEKIEYFPKKRQEFKALFPTLPYPQELNNLETSIEQNEEDSYNVLKYQFHKTGEVTEDQGNVFHSVEYKTKFNELLEKSSVSLKGDLRKDTEEYILKTIDTDYLNSTYIDSGNKGAKLIAIEQHALPFFHATYEGLRTDKKQPHADALDKALELTLDEKRVKAWDAGGFAGAGAGYDSDRLTNFKKIRVALAKDNMLYWSKAPIEGEVRALEESYTFVTTGRGEVPMLYRTLPPLYIGDKSQSGHEKMMIRLKATGMLDSEGKPIPEREKLIPQLQELLLKNPSDSTTYRTILESEDSEWMVGMLNAIHPDLSLDSVEDLQQVLINRQMMNNQNIGLMDTSWLNIPQIDPDLQMQWNEEVGELPPYLGFNTLLPGVATELVNTKLVTEEAESGFDMATLGTQPTETLKETWDRTLIGQGLNQLIDMTESVTQGKLSTGNQLIDRIISGRGAQEVKDYLREAPITAPLVELAELLDINPEYPEQLMDIIINPNEWDLIKQSDGNFKPVRKIPPEN